MIKIFTIEAIEGEFTVCKLPCGAAVPEVPFVFYAGTDSERSLVCRSEDVPKEALGCAGHRRLFRFAGTLDFSLIGVLAEVSRLLAGAGIGIFALSTYDTDYILTAAADFDRALALLEQNGYRVLAGSARGRA